MKLPEFLKSFIDTNYSTQDHCIEENLSYIGLEDCNEKIELIIKKEIKNGR